MTGLPTLYAFPIQSENILCSSEVVQVNRGIQKEKRDPADEVMAQDNLNTRRTDFNQVYFVSSFSDI